MSVKIQEITDIKELRSLRSEQVEVADKALAEEKPDEAKSALEQIKAIDERVAKVEKEIKEIKGDDEGEGQEDAPFEKEGEQRSMDKAIKPELNTATEETRKKEEEVRGIAHYIKTGEKRASVKTDDVGVTIPEAISYIPEHEIKTVQDLSALVQKTSVKNPSGKHPIVLRATAKFNTVEELKENPELAAPEFQEVDWSINTYRGAIPVSEEAIADSADNLLQLISNNIQEQKINTLNEKIGTVLKSFAPKTVKGVNDLKALINVDLDPAYDRQIICSQSFYQQLDTLVDGNGRYLLNDSIINTAGNKVLGMNVTVVRDDLLGAQGEANAFIGDVKRGVFFADRSDVSLSWNQHNIYGRYLMGAFRFDVQQADANAGFFVKADFSDAPAEAPAGDGLGA